MLDTFMAVNYDQILAGNCFGQIDVTTPANSTAPILIDKKELLTLSDEFLLSTEKLYELARQFVKGLK